MCLGIFWHLQKSKIPKSGTHSNGKRELQSAWGILSGAYHGLLVWPEAMAQKFCPCLLFPSSSLFFRAHSPLAAPFTLFAPHTFQGHNISHRNTVLTQSHSIHNRIFMFSAGWKGRICPSITHCFVLAEAASGSLCLAHQRQAHLLVQGILTVTLCLRWRSNRKANAAAIDVGIAERRKQNSLVARECSLELWTAGRVQSFTYKSAASLRVSD